MDPSNRFLELPVLNVPCEGDDALAVEDPAELGALLHARLKYIFSNQKSQFGKALEWKTIIYNMDMLYF
jgi:hypothetical protein